MPEASVPLIRPLGDRAVLVRFGGGLSEAANAAAVAFAARAESALPPGVVELAPNLVSVLFTYDPARIGYERLAGELRLLLSSADVPEVQRQAWTIPVTFDGEDLAAVCAAVGSSPEDFIAAHRGPLRVLATGFAPGFVYCGFHAARFNVPRRTEIRPQVPAGTVLFAARQTAIAATPVRTGWHVIGHTRFGNFDPDAQPPTRLRPGDTVAFEAAP